MTRKYKTFFATRWTLWENCVCVFVASCSAVQVIHHESLTIRGEGWITHAWVGVDSAFSCNNSPNSGPLCIYLSFTTVWSKSLRYTWQQIHHRKVLRLEKQSFSRNLEVLCKAENQTFSARLAVTKWKWTSKTPPCVGFVCAGLSRWHFKDHGCDALYFQRFNNILKIIPRVSKYITIWLWLHLEKNRFSSCRSRSVISENAEDMKTVLPAVSYACRTRPVLWVNQANEWMNEYQMLGGRDTQSKVRTMPGLKHFVARAKEWRYFL